MQQADQKGSARIFAINATDRPKEQEKKFLQEMQKAKNQQLTDHKHNTHEARGGQTQTQRKYQTHKTQHSEQIPVTIGRQSPVKKVTAAVAKTQRAHVARRSGRPPPSARTLFAHIIFRGACSKPRIAFRLHFPDSASFPQAVSLLLCLAQFFSGIFDCSCGASSKNEAPQALVLWRWHLTEKGAVSEVTSPCKLRTALSPFCKMPVRFLQNACPLFWWEHRMFTRQFAKLPTALVNVTRARCLATIPGSQRLVTPQEIGLDKFGGITTGKLYRNLTYDELFWHETVKDKLPVTNTGCVYVETGKFTGRSPADKWICNNPGSESSKNLDWNDKAPTKPITPEVWDHLEAFTIKQLNQNKTLYCFDGYCGASPKSRMSIRFITELAWQSHFVRNMFIRPTDEQLKTFKPDFIVMNGSLTTNPKWKEQGLNSENWTAFNFEKHMQVIGGLQYGGEMKKGIFALMNYYLPLKGDLSMHCSANKGKKGDTALFFGLSGTGKTTLSADPKRFLIGDDEHGWDEDGIFNFEGGCYAKTINLSREKEPEIYDAIRRDALLENVVVHNGVVDFKDGSKTENTRVSYPLHHIPNYEPTGRGAHPSNIIFLTADAFGVLPPIAKLSPGQAMYHFLSGYTAKVAGTERGIKEPTPNFSACFGQAFLTLYPTSYAKILGEKMKKHKTNAYLVNTGWTGGSYPKGARFDIPITRACIDAILSGELNNAEMMEDKILNLSIPKHVTGIPDDVLQPRKAWPSGEEYDKARLVLAGKFVKNFEKYTKRGKEFDFSEFGPRI
eukprot:g43353.t1